MRVGLASRFNGDIQTRKCASILPGAEFGYRFFPSAPFLTMHTWRGSQGERTLFFENLTLSSSRRLSAVRKKIPMTENKRMMAPCTTYDM